MGGWESSKLQHSIIQTSALLLNLRLEVLRLKLGPAQMAALSRGMADLAVAPQASSCSSHSSSGSSASSRSGPLLDSSPEEQQLGPGTGLPQVSVMLQCSVQIDISGGPCGDAVSRVGDNAPRR